MATPTPSSSLTPSPSTIKVENKRPKSTPVRNPAFREHEGLKALQKELNSRPRGKK